MFKLDLEKDIKLPTSIGTSKKQESFRKTSTSALLTMPKPLIQITTNWKIPKEMGIPDHLTCLLRNLYAGQEATVRTGHGTTDWLPIGKGRAKAEDIPDVASCENLQPDVLFSQLGTSPLFHVRF